MAHNVVKKVKVVFGETRLLVPCGDGKEKVERLIEDINRRFQAHLGDPTARAKELTTSDGFFINPHDIIDHVIDDSSVVIALDFKSWLQANLPLLEKGGHELSRPDYAGGNWRPPYRYAEIGRHKHNKIYVKIGPTTDQVDRLELFDAENLRTFGARGNGRVLIAHREVKETTSDATWDWSAQVHFIVEKGVVVAAELAVKATSDPRAQVEVVPINVVDLTLGKAEVQQTASFPKPAKSYTLPPNNHEGPSYTDKDFIASHLVPSGIVERAVPENVAQGNLGVEVKQKDAVQPDQSWPSGGSYNNLFYNNLALFNPQEKDVAIVKVTSEYQKDGEWVPMRTRLGDKYGYYRYSFGNTEGFVLESNERRNLAIESAIPITAPQYERERRAHRSLPSPMRIRITIEDKDGKTAQLVTEHVNNPLALITQESREKSQNRASSFWLSADDLEGEARVWVEAVHVPEEGRVEFASKPGDKSLYVYKNNLDYYLYLAKKDSKPEIVIEELTAEDTAIGYSVKTTALVDLENNWVYAIRFDIKTNTSSATGHYLLPDLTAA